LRVSLLQKIKNEALLRVKADPNLGHPSALVIAIQQRDVKLVEKLLDAGGKPFVADDSGVIPFFEAIYRSSPEVLKMLLERPDCNLKMEDKAEITPAIAVLLAGNKEKIALFIDKKAPLPLKLSYNSGEYFEKVLDRLVKLGDDESIKQILRWNKGDSENVEFIVGYYCFVHHPKLLQELIRIDLVRPNVVGPTLVSLFQRICQESTGYGFKKNQDLLELCLSKGADINKRDTWLETPLSRAVSTPDKELAKFLLRNGADVKAYDSDRLFAKIIELDDLELVQLAHKQGGNIHGTTQLPLQEAASNLQPDSTGEVFKWLVEQGADLNAIGDRHRTPFCEVVRSGNLALVEYCLSHNANLAPKDVPSALFWAAKDIVKDPEGRIFKKLVASGASLTDPAHDTAFGILAMSCEPAMLEWALANGAIVNPPNTSQRYTPLQMVARAEDPVNFKRLVEVGANINALDPAPLTSLAANGNVELVKWALTQGAEANIKQKSADSPLQAAAKAKNSEIFRLLLANGALINDKAATNIHPVLYVIQSGDAAWLAECFKAGAKLDDAKDQAQAWVTALSTGKLELLQLLQDQKIPLALQVFTTYQIQQAYHFGKGPLIEKLVDLKVDFKTSPDRFRDELGNQIVQNNDLVALRALLKAGFDPVIQGRNAIQSDALIQGKADILKILEQNGFPIDLKAVSEYQLSQIVYHQHMEVLKMLVAKKKKMDNKVFFFEIALSEYGAKKELLKYLLDSGVSAAQRLGKKQWPPIFVAVLINDVEAVKLILDAGGRADIHVVDKDSKLSALELAKQVENPAIFALLNS